MGGAPGGAVGVVVVTRDRPGELLTTLGHLHRLPERPPVAVVDNGSRRSPRRELASAFPGVVLLEPGRNLGAAGRTLGVRALGTPLVAFADDDSWWAPGALTRAARAFARLPHLGLLAARVLVGPGEALDPVSAEMARSPLGAVGGLPRVLGCLACGAVVRRSAYEGTGGFHPRYGVGGEEGLLAIDLAAHGWDSLYDDGLVAHHHPAMHAREGRSARAVRNELWTAWLRRPLPAAVGQSARTLAGAPAGAAARGALEAARGLPWVLSERRVAPPAVEARLAAL